MPPAADGAERVRGLPPSGDASEVAHRQALTAEAIALLDHAAEPPLDRIHDVRSAAALAARGGVLTPDARHRIAWTVAGGLQARAAVEAERQLAPLLAEIASAVEPGLAPVAKEIDRCV